MYLIHLYHFFYNETKNKFALAGSRTRISCLEGNYANRYTTNAYKIETSFKSNEYEMVLKIMNLIQLFVI